MVIIGHDMHEMSLIPPHLSPFVIQTSPAFCFFLLPSTPGRVSQEQSGAGKDLSFVYSLKKYTIQKIMKIRSKRTRWVRRGETSSSCWDSHPQAQELNI